MYNLTEDAEKVIRDSVIRMLARREYGFQELYAKLLQKGFFAHDIESVLCKCKESGLQNDQRFADAIIRNTAAKGQGKQNAIRRLKHLKIDDHIIHTAIAEAEIDWYALATRVKVKKFGDDLAADYQQVTKQYRFLSYRGFSQEEIDCAIRATPKQL